MARGAEQRAARAWRQSSIIIGSAASGWEQKALMLSTLCGWVAQSHWGWMDAKFLAHHARVTLHNTIMPQRRQDSSSSTPRPGRLTVDCVWTLNLAEHFYVGRVRMFRKVYKKAGGRRNAGWSRIEQLAESVYHLQQLSLRQRFS